MGFFSWSCLKCGRSAVAARNGPEWSSDIVVLTPNGNKWCGIYDGYGNVGGVDLLEIAYDGGFSLYHTKCWEKEGKPDFTKQSPDASDQGYFFNDEDYPDEAPDDKLRPRHTIIPSKE